MFEANTQLTSDVLSRLKVVLLVIAFIPVAATADVAAGLAAQQEGDFTAAATHFRISAEQDDPAGQTLLANLYADGIGVPVGPD